MGLVVVHLPVVCSACDAPGGCVGLHGVWQEIVLV